MPRLSPDAPLVHPDCEIADSSFGAYTEVGRGSRIAHSSLGDYSYCDRYADIANATVGKFANIASFTRIGATDHPLDTAACHHFLYRSDDYWDDADRDAAFFAHRQARRARVGHDTWIGHAAMIKPEVTDIVGGRSGAYERKLQDAREVAFRELEQRAQNLGGNAVVGVDIDYEVVGQSMLMVSASGTAVVIE